MPIWLTKALTDFLTQLASWLVTQGLEHAKKTRDRNDSMEQVDTRLNNIRQAYAKAFDGTPPTPEQKKEIQKAVADFIRGGDPRGL